MYSSSLPSASALDGGGYSTPRSGRFNPGKDVLSIVWEAGWTPRPLWTGAENLTSTGIRSPDRPAHSESLHRMRHPPAPPPPHTHTHVGYIIFVGKPNVNRRLGRPKIKCEVNIKMNLENSW